MTISFDRRIKGKEDDKCIRLSVTVPKTIADEYELNPGDFVNVTLRYDIRNPDLKFTFAKKICRCGTEGRVIYLPKKLVIKYGLHRNQVVTLTLRVLGEV